MPNKGGMLGGQTVTITGSGWAYDAGEYVDDGLVAHYDAINNTGFGDNNHSDNTATWKNLAPTGTAGRFPDEANLCTAGCRTYGESDRLNWTDNSLYFSPYTGVTNSGVGVALGDQLTDGNYTIEVIARRRSGLIMNIPAHNYFAFLISNAAAGDGSGFAYCNQDADVCTGKQGNIGAFNFYQKDTYPDGTIFSYNQFVSVGDQLLQTGQLQALSMTQKVSGATSCSIRVAVNGVGDEIQMYDTLQSLTPPSHCSYQIGGNYVLGAHYNVINTDTTFQEGSYSIADMDIFSARIYSRPLTAAETEQNYQVDRARFLAVPEITIDGSACTNVTVISATKLTCKTPAHDVAETVDVGITYDGQTSTLPSSFTYQDLSITGVSPTSGPTTGGQRITITGVNLPYVATNDYAQAPSISIGTDGSGWSRCMDVAVLDYSTATCTTGAHSIITNARVRLTPYGSSTNYEIESAYSYVDPATNAYINSYTPNYLDAVGGETLQFTGGNLNTVTSVTIDSLLCSINTATQTARMLECTTPPEGDFRPVATGDNGNRKSLVLTAPSNVINGKVEYREFLTLASLSNVNLSSTNRTNTQNMAISTNSQSGYNVTVQTVNVGRDTAHRSDLLCERSGNKYYITPVASETPTLSTGGTYGVKQGSGNYLPLSHSPIDLHSTTSPSLNLTTPDTFPLTTGVNTDLPAVACSNYTGILLYTVTAK